MSRTRQLLVAAVSAALLQFGFVTTASAGLVGTQQVLGEESRADDRAAVERVLAHAEVRDALLTHGVDADHLDARLDAMTDAELAELATEFETLPAGAGVVEVVGVVFIVLIILELVGVTNIFSSF